LVLTPTSRKDYNLPIMTCRTVMIVVILGSKELG
jgi:hypothetical protein